MSLAHRESAPIQRSKTVTQELNKMTVSAPRGRVNKATQSKAKVIGAVPSAIQVTLRDIDTEGLYECIEAGVAYKHFLNPGLFFIPNSTPEAGEDRSGQKSSMFN